VVSGQLGVFSWEFFEHGSAFGGQVLKILEILKIFFGVLERG